MNRYQLPISDDFFKHLQAVRLLIINEIEANENACLKNRVDIILARRNNKWWIPKRFHIERNMSDRKLFDKHQDHFDWFRLSCEESKLGDELENSLAEIELFIDTCELNGYFGKTKSEFTVSHDLQKRLNFKAD